MSVNVVVTIQQVCAAAASGQGLSRLLATTLQRWRLGLGGGCDVRGWPQTAWAGFGLLLWPHVPTHYNLVHSGTNDQMNLFPSQLSLYTSGPAPVVAVVCCGAVVATAAAAAAAVVRRGYNSCLLCPHSGRPRPLYCTVPHSTVLYSGYRWWSLLNISSEIRSCHRDHHKSGGWWLDRRQRIYISFIYS